MTAAGSPSSQPTVWLRLCEHFAADLRALLEHLDLRRRRCWVLLVGTGEVTRYHRQVRVPRVRRRPAPFRCDSAVTPQYRGQPRVRDCQVFETQGGRSSRTVTPSSRPSSDKLLQTGCPRTGPHQRQAGRQLQRRGGASPYVHLRVVDHLSDRFPATTSRRSDVPTLGCHGTETAPCLRGYRRTAHEPIADVTSCRSRVALIHRLDHPD